MTKRTESLNKTLYLCKNFITIITTIGSFASLYLSSTHLRLFFPCSSYLVHFLEISRNKFVSRVVKADNNKNKQTNKKNEETCEVNSVSSLPNLAQIVVSAALDDVFKLVNEMNT